MDTRKFAVQQAVKLVSTMSIENKTKAVFDLALEIEKWIVDVVQKPKEGVSWFGDPIPYTPTPTSGCVTYRSGSTEG